MGLEHRPDGSDPTEHFCALHSADVFHEGFGKLFGVDVLLQDGKDLIEQLLLMQVVELQSGIHLVDDDVLMHESWELVHDGRDQPGIIFEANVNMGAGDHLASAVHAHVELEELSMFVDSLNHVSHIVVMSHGTVALLVVVLLSSGMSLSFIRANVDGDLLGSGLLQFTKLFKIGRAHV